MTPESIETWESYPQMMENKRKEIESWPERKKEYDEKIRQWEVESAAAKAEGREPSKRPWVPGPPEAGQYMPAQLYKAMVHPFIRLPVRGFLWYQGESNAGGGEGGGRRYTELQNRLIRQHLSEKFHRSALPGIPGGEAGGRCHPRFIPQCGCWFADPRWQAALRFRSWGRGSQIRARRGAH